MDQLFDDKSRLTTYIEILSEKFVDDLVNFYLWNANYPQHFNLIFDRYTAKRKEILFQFSNNKIRANFEKLNNSFDLLLKFLTLNFSVPKSLLRHETNIYTCYLLPRYHHNFRLDEGSVLGEEEKDAFEWNKHKKELDHLAENFELSYKKFVAVAKNEIENLQPNLIFKLLNFLKKHLVELIIGILVTVIGGIILSVIL
jgi:hypothetical protein